MPETNVDVMNGLLGKIYQVMTAPNAVISGAQGRSNVETEQPPFISFCSPGIAVDLLEFGNLLTIEQVNACSSFSQIINSIPAVNGIWQATSAKTWEVYDRCITDIQLPESNLTVREQEILQRAENFLREEVTIVDPFTNEERSEIRATGAYQAYDSLFTAYNAALKRYNDSRITAISDPTPVNVADWTNNGPIYESVVRSAYSRWGSLGYRDYVNRANAIIAQYTARGPERYYEQLRLNLELARRLDGRGVTFWPTFVYPEKILNPAFNDSWTNFTYSRTEIDQFSSSSSTSWGGGVSGSYGLWSWGGSTSYQNRQERYNADTSQMEIRADLIQVPLLRPWMTTWIFSSRGWRGGTTIGGPGSISSGIPPLTGQMPLLPTSMILAKNVEIDMDTTSEEYRYAYERFSSSASVGYGPFSIRGNYTREESSTSHNYEENSAGLRSRGTQIIAFICEVLPTSPNPDESLNWPDRLLKETGYSEEAEDYSWLLSPLSQL